MQIVGIVVLSLVGLGFFGITCYSASRCGWKLTGVHPVLGGLSALMIMAAFLPLTEFTIGSSGLSAKIDRAAKRMEVLEAVVASESPQAQGIIDTLSQGARSQEWVAVPPSVAPPKPTASSTPPAVGGRPASGSRSGGRPRGGGGGGGDRAPSESPASGEASAEHGSDGPPSTASKPPETPETPGSAPKPPDVPESIRALADRGVVDVQNGEGRVMVRVRPEWAAALD